MKGIIFKEDDVWKVRIDDNVFLLHPKDNDVAWRFNDGQSYEVSTLWECPHYDGTHFGKGCSCKTGLIEYMTIRSLYSQIEYYLIDWSLNGKKTAGTATREILKMMDIYNKKP